MSFLNPLFLLGLAALAAPVLVHLVRRTRARRVEFPALVFVRQVPQRTIRRRTLHNLLLLLLRCLAVLLIVFAFTRPFFTGPEGRAASGGARHTVILLDASLSMRHEGRFAEALRRADALVGEAQQGERFALVTFDEGYEVVSGFDADRGAVRAALAGLAAGYGATDYEQALRGAESLLREAKGAAPRRVLMISDFQATGWATARATFKLAGDVRLALIEVGGGTPANAAVTNVEARGAVYGQKYADRLAVHVSNFAEEGRGPFTLDFQINDQTVEKREVILEPREQKVIEFTGFNLAEGPNRCVVRLRADDFAPDNEFYFTLRRVAPAKALIVDGGSRGRGDSFYLQNALAAGGGLPYTFDVRSASAVDPASLAAHSLVILNDAGVAPGPLTEAVNAFVEAGGRLVIAAGPHTRAEGFNRAFGRVAPATLGEAVQFRQAEGVAMTEVTASHPIFEIFRDGARPPSARVFGYQRAEPREGADVLARFEDGAPAFVESASGRGRVLLYTSTLGMGWSDLPLTPAYLPLVQQMVRYLGEREASAWHRLGQAFAVAREAGGSPPAVDTPSGVRLKTGGLTPDGEMLLAGREPGFYRLRYAAGHEFAAVNVDAREGDFARLDTEEFLAAFTGGGPVAPAGADERASAEETEARQRVWWPLLLAAILFLTAESLLSRRKRLAKMIG
jgi:Aerotolerance regulator N-terminal/von Willebrand factor type A domain